MRWTTRLTAGSSSTTSTESGASGSRSGRTNAPVGNCWTRVMVGLGAKVPTFTRPLYPTFERVRRYRRAPRVIRRRARLVFAPGSTAAPIDPVVFDDAPLAKELLEMRAETEKADRSRMDRYVRVRESDQVLGRS